MAGSPQGRRRPYRKVLPDRSRAARDRANQKLVEYIVKARGAEGHLRAILKNRKPSRWLKTFLNSGQYVTCVETYLEDEDQLDLVVKYLQGVYQETGSRTLARVNGDRIRFILDVLLPEVSGRQGRRARWRVGVYGRSPGTGPPAMRGWGLVLGWRSPEVCPGGHGSMEPGARPGAAWRPRGQCRGTRATCFKLCARGRVSGVGVAHGEGAVVVWDAPAGAWLGRRTHVMTPVVLKAGGGPCWARVSTCGKGCQAQRSLPLCLEAFKYKRDEDSGREPGCPIPGWNSDLTRFVSLAPSPPGNCGGVPQTFFFS